MFPVRLGGMVAPETYNHSGSARPLSSPPFDTILCQPGPGLLVDRSERAYNITITHVLNGSIGAF